MRPSPLASSETAKPTATERLEAVHAALYMGALGCLLKDNDLAVPLIKITPRWAYPPLNPAEKHHLQKTVQCYSVSDICNDWNRTHEPEQTYHTVTNTRRQLIQRYCATNTVQMVALAGDKGDLPCSPLTDVPPLTILSRDQMALVGLLSYGIKSAQLNDIYKTSPVDLAYFTLSACRRMAKCLPADEPVPRAINTPWLVHTAQRLDILPRNRRVVENLDVQSLYEGMVAFMHPERSVHFPSWLKPPPFASTPHNTFPGPVPGKV